MRHGACRLDEMADGALTEGPVFPLPAQELDGVIPLNGGGNGVGAIVTTRTANPHAAGGMPVQGLVQDDIGMTGVTPRFIEPGIGILGNLIQIPMTIGAGHPIPEHDIPQALGVWAGVALVAAVDRAGDYPAPAVSAVHGLGEIGYVARTGVP